MDASIHVRPPIYSDPVGARTRRFASADDPSGNPGAVWQALNQHAMVSMTDAAGTITFVNDAFVRVSGYSRDELLGCSHRCMKSNVQGPAFWEAMWNTIASGNVWKGVVCNRAKDGALYWVESQVSPFFGPSGQIDHYLSVGTDITHHVQAPDKLEIAKSLQVATEALQLRRFYLRATLDNLPFQFWLKDAQGRYLAVNQVFADVCGYPTADEVTGLTDREASSGF